MATFATSTNRGVEQIPLWSNISTQLKDNKINSTCIVKSLSYSSDVTVISSPESAQRLSKRHRPPKVHFDLIDDHKRLKKRARQNALSKKRNDDELLLPDFPYCVPPLDADDESICVKADFFLPSKTKQNKKYQIKSDPLGLHDSRDHTFAKDIKPKFADPKYYPYSSGCSTERVKYLVDREKKSRQWNSLKPGVEVIIIDKRSPLFNSLCIVVKTPTWPSTWVTAKVIEGGAIVKMRTSSLKVKNLGRLEAKITNGLEAQMQKPHLPPKPKNRIAKNSKLIKAARIERAATVIKSKRQSKPKKCFEVQESLPRRKPVTKNKLPRKPRKMRVSTENKVKAAPLDIALIISTGSSPKLLSAGKSIVPVSSEKDPVSEKSLKSGDTWTSSFVPDETTLIDGFQFESATDIAKN